MNTESIIAEIDAEIYQLQQAKAILSGTDVKKPIGRPKTIPATSKSVAAKPAKIAKRVMSAEGKAKIAAAQKARWAKTKKAAKKIAAKSPTA